MLIRALLILAFGFAVLFLARLTASRRRALAARWPAIALAVAAFWELSRGGIELALVCAGLAVLSWFVAPRMFAPAGEKTSFSSPTDIQACAVLGVSASASEAEIRRAYRMKVAKVHPDRGGSAAETARLSAARDQLVRRLRGRDPSR